METLEEGDKVLFAGQILTLKQYDTWFNKWDFVEKAYHLLNIKILTRLLKLS